MKNLAEEIVHFLYNAKLPIEDRNFYQYYYKQNRDFCCNYSEPIKAFIEFLESLGGSTHQIICYVKLSYPPTFFIYIVDIDEHSKYNISIDSIDSPQSSVTRERFFYDEIVIVQRDIEKRTGYGEIIVQYYALKENKVGIKFAKKFCKLVKQKIFKPIKKQ